MSSTAIAGTSGLRPPIRTRWLVLGALLVFALIVARCYHYYVQWCENRFDEYYRLHAYYRIHSGFINDFKQGRLDAAYDATSPSFRARVSREEFAQLVRAYIEFHDKPDARVVGGTPIKPVDPGYRGKEVVTDTYTLQDGDGNQLDVSTTVLIEDSIFHRHPPTPMVDDFSVNYTPSAGERK